jgi:hypothetical protein
LCWPVFHAADLIPFTPFDAVGEASEASAEDEDSDLFDSEEEEAISKGLKDGGKTLGECRWLSVVTAGLCGVLC